VVRHSELCNIHSCTLCRELSYGGLFTEIPPLSLAYEIIFFQSLTLPEIHDHRWRNRGSRMGLDPPLLFLGRPAPPFFCLNIVSLSKTISIGSSDKVNRLMKKLLQKFGSIF